MLQVAQYRFLLDRRVLFVPPPPEHAGECVKGVSVDQPAQEGWSPQ